MVPWEPAKLDQTAMDTVALFGPAGAPPFVLPTELGPIDETAIDTALLFGPAGPPTVTLPAKLDFSAATKNITDPAQMEGLAALAADVVVSTSLAAPDTTAFDTAMDGVETKLDVIDDTVATADVKANVLGALLDIGRVQLALNKLTDKTITVRVNTVGTVPTAGVGGGGGGGGVPGVDGRGADQRADLPPRSVSAATARRSSRSSFRSTASTPSVRHLAEMIRGQHQAAPAAGGTGRTVNNYLSITPQAADPAAVAHAGDQPLRGDGPALKEQAMHVGWLTLGEGLRSTRCRTTSTSWSTIGGSWPTPGTPGLVGCSTATTAQR